MSAAPETSRWRWAAVIVGILTGAGLVVFGYLTGSQWAGMVGGMLVGGGTGLGITTRTA